MDRRTAVPGHAGGLTVLLALVAVMGGAATALALRAAHLLGTLPAVRAEPYLELVAVVVGAAAAVWVGASALLGLVCVVARSLGRSWASGERLVGRVAPAVVRRAARAGIGLSVGAGLVLSGGAAQAGTTVQDDPGVIVAVDLGWRPSDPATTEATPSVPGRSGTEQSDTEAATPSAELSVETPAPAPSAEQVTEQEDLATPVPVGDAPGAGADVTPTTSPGAASLPTGGTGTPPAAAPQETGPTGVPPSAAAEQRDAALTVTRDVVLETPSHEVVVVRGDTLWEIAARHLPSGASDAQVADAVQRWHTANADVVGDDPDLIRPGQVLVAPTA